jgi:hypothetical protein
MDELLALRLALLGVLLLFVAVVALTMRSGLAPGRQPAALPAQRTRAHLAVVAPAGSGIQSGAIFDLAGVMTIGRDPGNSIVVPDASVSGEHAVIRLHGRTWVLSDLGSTNGTLLNNEPVDGSGKSLRGGERITIGAVVFRFQT